VHGQQVVAIARHHLRVAVATGDRVVPHRIPIAGFGEAEQLVEVLLVMLVGRRGDDRRRVGKPTGGDCLGGNGGFVSVNAGLYGSVQVRLGGGTSGSNQLCSPNGPTVPAAIAGETGGRVGGEVGWVCVRGVYISGPARAGFWEEVNEILPGSRRPRRLGQIRPVAQSDPPHCSGIPALRRPAK
jgi:hypothetical protein